MKNIFKDILTPARRRRLKHGSVVTLIVSIFAAVMFLNYNATKSEKKEEKKGLNATVPAPEGDEIISGGLRSTSHMEGEKVRDLGDVMQRQMEGVESIRIPVSQENVAKANRACDDISKTVDSFYERPTVDSEKVAMRAEIEALKSQIETQQQLPDTSIDEQVELMERSYELAARYSGEQPSSQSDKEEEREVVSAISQPRCDVVSSLTPLSDSNFSTPTAPPEQPERNTIAAALHSDQTIIDGGAIKIRLMESMEVDGCTLPLGTTITGQGKISGERLDIKIEQIEHAGRVMHVQMVIIDTDGVEGIFVPNSMEVSALKEVVANMGSTLGSSITLTEQSASDQVLSDLGKGAIQGVSKYAAKKIREVKVHLKAGYRVMLYQEEK